MNPNLHRRLTTTINRLQGNTVELLQALVRIPSTNHPPTGDEIKVQEFYAGILRSFGLDTELFEPDKVPGFEEHPGRLADHEMKNRPVVFGHLKGSGVGRSLLLMAHADTEITGDSALWTGQNPFSGVKQDGKVMGRGSGDDKSGMAINAMVVRVLKESGVRLKGDLLIASVPDEEMAGGNGSIALMAKGIFADAGIFVDGTNMELGCSGLGVGNCVVDFSIPHPAVDAEGLLACLDQIRRGIQQLKQERARHFIAHPHYQKYFQSNSPVVLTKLQIATDDNTHGSFLLWVFLLPGEGASDVQALVEKFIMGSCIASAAIKFHWMKRFLLPAEIPPDHEIIETIRTGFRLATGNEIHLGGSLASDMGLINHYGGFPCVIFGPIRWGVKGMAHQPDEFVVIDDLMICLQTIVFAVIDWCGVDQEGMG